MLEKIKLCTNKWAMLFFLNLPIIIYLNNMYKQDLALNNPQ